MVKTPGGLVTLEEASNPAVITKLAAARKQRHPALGEFMATSIAGNDLLSSVRVRSGPGREAATHSPTSHPAAPTSHSAALPPLAPTHPAQVLYTAGICVQYAGKLAPVALLLVSFMLSFFRFVYAEVVAAMPVNGGFYIALLNTTRASASRRWPPA